MTEQTAGKTDLDITDYRKTLEFDPKDDFIKQKLANLIIAGERQSNPKAKFDKLIEEFNPLSITYTEKVNSLLDDQKNRTADEKTYCQTL